MDIDENETISLRDYFAAKAMQSLVTLLHSTTSYLEPIAQRSYALADIMLDERDKNKCDAASPTGCSLIAAERKRQINVKMHYAEDDDSYTKNELVEAACAYINHPALPQSTLLNGYNPEWPWNPSTLKAGDRKNNLIKAGALIAAELDRLLRAENKREE